ncbi:Mannose-1-phosphate guanyltransferase 2 [Thelohanellus kitauei]|uniref:Mannose-1-phosphate guanyltransferase 2 n=1 Tax=Thelohanellus kitauei TaxID=669202 RepID=A0A0C2N1T5_THEKT|nr:Mannose-1-phosphate guanyltransferase 2 [Thelohanellus kitauei]
MILDRYPLESAHNIIGKVFVDRTAVVDPTSRIGPNVSIGPNCVIKSGVRIYNCILLDDVVVDSNTFLKDTIVCSNAVIGKWCRIEGKLHKDYFDYYRNAPSNYSHFSLDGKKHPDVTVVGSSVIVKDMVFIYNTVILPYKHIQSDCTSEIIM